MRMSKKTPTVSFRNMIGGFRSACVGMTGIKRSFCRRFVAFFLLRCEMSSSVGYVHNLSPKKTAKNGTKYFSFELETSPQTFTRSVCFDANLHEPFNDYMSSGTPVKVKNVQRKPSIMNPNDKDIIINKRSKVEEANNGDVQFEISAVHAAGTIKVRLWDSYCDLQSGRGYSFANLKVRQYGKHKYLTTAPSTTVNEIDEKFPAPDEDELNDVASVRVQGFKMINNYATWYTCLNCSKHVTDVPTLKSAKCNHCKSIMLLEACPKMVSVRVAITDPANEECNLWLTVFRDVLMQMIPATIRHGWTEDEVVERLLELENFEIEFDKGTNIVRSIQL